MELLQKQFQLYMNIFLIIILSFVLYGVVKQVKYQQEEEVIQVSSKQGNLRFTPEEEFAVYFSQEVK